MPRLSQHRREEQAARIVRAAEACFARRGFQASSMDEIISEAGMSSSTVYRYFPQGKESLVRAVLDRAGDPVSHWLAELSARAQLPPFKDALLEGARRCLSAKGVGEPPDPDGASASLLLHAWSEHLDDPVLVEARCGSHRALRAQLVALVARWQAAGQIAADLEPEVLAAVVHNLVLGLLVSGTVDDGTGDLEPTVSAVASLVLPHPDAGSTGSGRGPG